MVKKHAESTDLKHIRTCPLIDALIFGLSTAKAWEAQIDNLLMAHVGGPGPCRRKGALRASGLVL